MIFAIHRVPLWASLDSNSITDTGALALAQALATNSTLKELKSVGW